MSLLQPVDSAYGDAAAVVQFLTKHGFVVRCVTRSTLTGLLGIGRVAGFQTDRGTVTVLLVADGEQIHVEETRVPGGYRYIFTKAGPHPARIVETHNGPVYYLERGNWFIEVWDAGLATELRQFLSDSRR